MKLIKFKNKIRYKYTRKVIIKNFIINIFIGLHDFEKRKKQRVRFNLEIVSDENVKPNSINLKSIVNYEDIINKITYITNKKHFELLEDLAEEIFDIIFNYKIVKKIKIKIEKLDIIRNTESVGVEIIKKRNE